MNRNVTNQGHEPWVPSGLCPVGERRRMSSRSRNLLTLPVLGVLLVVLTSGCSALDRLTARISSGIPDWWAPVGLAVHSAHSAMETARLRSLIEQVRFNQTTLSFEQGVMAGPGAGELEIRFATPASSTSDHLRYRLFGFDTEWREAGKERDIVYPHLAPGRYEFDLQRAESGNWTNSAVQSIPITVAAPYWQTGKFRSLCMMTLLLLVLALHKLRVRYLVRHVHKLQETVNLTRAELTLAAKIAGDAQEALKEQALKDGLTGLWNRRAIAAMLENEVCRALRDRFPIALVMIDLDYFKSINDTYGHLTGDEVLREVAGRLIGEMRPYDFAGRYGGEEFLVVMPSCSPHNGIRRAEDFRRAVAQRPVPTPAGPLDVTCSLGVALYDYAMSPEDLIHRADEALYRAKRMGRNCVCAGS